MFIHHLAIQTKDLEKMKDFYVQYFHSFPGKKYINRINHFEFYFLDFNGEK